MRPSCIDQYSLSQVQLYYINRSIVPTRPVANELRAHDYVSISSNTWDVAMQLSVPVTIAAEDVQNLNNSEQQRRQRQREEGAQGFSEGIVDQSDVANTTVGGSSINGDGSRSPGSFQKRGQY